MRQTAIVRPDYAERFACIGPACEDTCCAGWSVSVDEEAYRKYTALPPSPLRSLIDVAIVRAEGGSQPDRTAFATVRMSPSGVCPFLSEERLCSIQAEHGAEYLCRTCARFPRTTHTIDRLSETTLSLACPEAARLVLLDPRSLDPGSTDPHYIDPPLPAPAAAPRYRLTWDETASPSVPLKAWFWQIREFAVSLVRNRSYPLWQRMFLLGVFARRLEALARGELERSFPVLLRDFSRAVAAGGLRAQMETIPADLHLQLEFVLELIAQRVNGVPIGSRLREVLDLFVLGVGHSRSGSMGSQAARYTEAYAHFYSPFFSRHPHILENYLVNAMLYELFPFGRGLADPDFVPQPARAFATLALQFTLIKGLLIGVAGARGEAFSTAEVILAVQAACKHFEHNRQFLPASVDLLAARGLDDARGLTMLVRN